MMQKMTAAITAVEGYLPEEIVTNEDLSKIVETSDEWITSRTGIKERRIMRNGTTSDSGCGCSTKITRKKRD